MVSSAQAPDSSALLHGYRFTTGVDQNLWMTGTGQSAVCNSYAHFNMPWGYQFFDSIYSQYTISTNGRVMLGNSHEMPYIQAWCNFDSSNGIWVGRLSSVMSSGARNHVIELRGQMGYAAAYRQWEIFFNEEDASFTLIYGTVSDSYTAAVPIEIHFDDSTMIAVDPRTHTAGTTPLSDLSDVGWPGSYRYYKFTPECHLPKTFAVDSLGSAMARLKWYNHDSLCFGVYLDTVVDTILNWRDIDASAIRRTHGSSMVFDSLQPGTTYMAYLVTRCFPEGDTLVKWLRFTMPCPHILSGRIDYDVRSPLAQCRYGTVGWPSSDAGAVDFGSESISSRHTMNCDPNETDPRTGNQLRIIPPGYSTSVRLGNWNNGGEEEDITYTLHVDTGNYDLLLLRYALVEEQPNHGPYYNPKFLYSINDSLGRLINSCYYGNFVSGDASGWNHADIYVVWKDWTAVGIDLGPLHGQTIQVKIANYDCAQYGHYGYGYFVLDGITKHLNSETCGDDSSSKFRAPEGFAYRWYAEEHPDSTLSTADTLVVAEEGYYRCRVSYLTDSFCGFTMRTYAGPRYPHAAFSAAPADTCPLVLQFGNGSVVAKDQAGQQLTDIPCDSYLWRFGDGDTSAEASPAHRYPQPGTYSVTLYAMLGNGRCVDSLTQTVTATMPSIEIYDTICLGQQRLFHGDTLTRSGTYYREAGCAGETLHLLVREEPQPPSYEMRCGAAAGYRFALADTLHYRFASLPADTALPQGAVPGAQFPDGWSYMPADTLDLIVAAGYGPRLLCPVADTVVLIPFVPVSIQLSVTPSMITSGNREVLAHDRGDSAWLRQWYVDGELQDETGPQLRFVSGLGSDSVRICLIASTDYCSDTACRTIPVLSGEPYFPNVFTPGAGPNGSFRGYGTNIRDYRLEIFTKWGDCFFRSTDIEEGWDGTRNGRRCPAGAYVYRCLYTDSEGRPATIVGTVLLVR